MPAAAAPPHAPHQGSPARSLVKSGRGRRRERRHGRSHQPKGPTTLGSCFPARTEAPDGTGEGDVGRTGRVLPCLPAPSGSPLPSSLTHTCITPRSAGLSSPGPGLPACQPTCRASALAAGLGLSWACPGPDPARILPACPTRPSPSAYTHLVPGPGRGPWRATGSPGTPLPRPPGAFRVTAAVPRPGALRLPGTSV